MAVGDRLQFTAPCKQHANRDLGTIAAIDGKVNSKLETDKGQNVQWNVRENACVDRAYAFTSHSVQGSTVDRTLANIETLNSHVDALLDKDFSYVGMSRQRFD